MPIRVPKQPVISTPGTAMNNRLMIDAGMSSRGWSFYNKYLICPRSNYLSRERRPETTAPQLLKGSMGHLLQAHHRAIDALHPETLEWVDPDKHWVLAGANPDDIVALGLQDSEIESGVLRLNSADILHSPQHALDVWVQRNPQGAAHYNTMMQIYNKWRVQPDPIMRQSRTVAVETQIILDLGVNKTTGEFGLWIRADRVSRLLATETLPEYDPILLDCPGHPDHGQVIHISRRADHIKIVNEYDWVLVDHKHQAKVDPDDANRKYRIDGGFQIFDIIGERLWGNQFKGNQLNLISTTGSPTEVPFIPRAIGHKEVMAETVLQFSNEIARLDLEYLAGTRPALKMPHRMSETGPCFGGKYGPCLFVNVCMNNNPTAPLRYE